MEWLTPIFSWSLPGIATFLVTAAVVWAILRTTPTDPTPKLVRQLSLVAVVVLSMVVLVVVLPLTSETRGQLLSLYGVVITAVIALSSTTFVSNIMAGLALRAVGSFHPGDFIRVGEHFGRVTEKALLHTEIQSEDRDLVTLPNLFVMTQAVRVVHSAGTLISAEVSLGYDVDRQKVRDTLKQAAEDAELSDPFVLVLELGDFSVTYRVSGFLDDLGNLVSKRSELRSRMLDALHAEGIEIVSPNYMNQRQLQPGDKVIPQTPVVVATPEDEHAETLMFDKAEVAGRMQRFREQRDELIEQVKQLEQEDASANELEVRWRKRQIETLEEMLATLPAQ